VESEASELALLADGGVGELSRRHKVAVAQDGSTSESISGHAGKWRAALTV
jgi:hypothetical protein